MILHAMGEEWLDQMEGKEPKPVVADPLNARQVAAEKAWITRDREGKVFYMLSEVTSLKYEGGYLRTHIDKMERLFNNIAASDKKFELNTGLQKLFLYKSLGPDWREFVDNLQSRDLRAEAVTKLLERELRNRDDESAAVESANFTKRKFHRGKGGAKDSGEEIKRNQCRNCKEFGHWAYKCPKKKGKKKYQANMANNDSSEELTLAEEVLCAQTEVEGFIVDSGCTSVMIKDKGMLHDCKKSSGSVQLGSKTEIPIGAVGALALEVGAKRVELPEVLHVPNLRRNLLSVSKLADLGIVTIFDRTSVSFYETSARMVGRKLSAGIRDQNLYTFGGRLEEANVAVSGQNQVEKSAAEEMSFLLEEPDTIEEALRSTEGAQWEKAAQDELRSMGILQVWDLVDLPEGRIVVDCKWVLKKKISAKGKLQRYKARLVARGFTQKKGLDYDETFSPVVHMDSFRTMMAVAARED
ncbi:hypothetical protein R1sor_002994 [Riccia sorocarpa]|uniref:CCHC-type domain-containing protein n=1 Tax=Riccia sorocarpa TaxID=122646 RepID=A0ABD3H318_9MARC